MASLDNYSINATEVRKTWSTVVDTAVHRRPVFIKRTHDNITMINSQSFESLLEAYKFHIAFIAEKDGSITASIKEIDIVDNASNKVELVEKLINDLREYAEDFYSEFDYWYSATNRRSHVPYVLKILMSTDEQIKEAMICRVGRN